MSQLAEKIILRKTSIGNGNRNTSRNEDKNWISSYEEFENLLDHNSTRFKNLSKIMGEFDALKKLAHDASIEVLNAITIFVTAAVWREKFLSPDRVDRQIRKIMAAESLLLKTRREDEEIDDFLNVDMLRGIRRRFSHAVNRAESFSVDVKKHRLLLSDLDHNIELALIKTKARALLEKALEEALRCDNKLESLTKARKKLIAAINKAKSVGLNVSHEQTVVEGIEHSLEKSRDERNARSKLQKIILQARSVKTFEDIDKLSQIQQNLALAIKKAKAAGIETQDARKVLKDIRNAVSEAGKRMKAKNEAQKVLNDILDDVKGTIGNTDNAFLRSLKKKFDRAIVEARTWDIDTKSAELLAKRLAKLIDIAERKNQANKELQAARHIFESTATTDDTNILTKIHLQLKSAIHNASRMDMDVTDDKILAKDLKVRIGMIKNFGEARSHLDNIQKKFEHVTLDASSRALREVSRQLSKAIDRVQASKVDDFKSDFGENLLRSHYDRLERINHAINVAQEKENAKRRLSIVRKKATHLQKNPSTNTVQKVRKELLETINNAKTVGLQVSEGFIWKTFLDVDQRIFDDLDKAEVMAERADAKGQLHDAKKEVKLIDLKTADEPSLQKVRDNMVIALERAQNIGISIEWDEKLLVPLERAIAKVIQEKSDLSKALEAFSDSAQSASVEEGLEKLKEIRKNLNSVISRSQ